MDCAPNCYYFKSWVKHIISYTGNIYKDMLFLGTDVVFFPCRLWTRWLGAEPFVTWMKWMLSMGLKLLSPLELSPCALSPAPVLASTGCRAGERESLWPKWASEQPQLS